MLEKSYNISLYICAPQIIKRHNQDKSSYIHLGICIGRALNNKGPGPGLGVLLPRQSLGLGMG
jgi:hypothetical protein